MNNERIDGLREDISALRNDLKAHVEEENNVLLRLGRSLEASGSPEEILQRRFFVELLMKREARREKLFQAIIEKSLVAAVIATVAYLGLAAWHEFLGVLNLMRGGK